MSVRPGAVTLKSQPVALEGDALRVGGKAPEFQLVNSKLETVCLSDSAGKTRIVATVPSLDTSTCHAEAKRFNDEAGRLPGAVVYVVSMDLPFGQKRWCGAEDVAAVVTLSDHRTAEFGKAYGVLIADGPLQRCLARAVFVIDGAGTLTHVEYVPEIAGHPDYDAALAAARA